jgi:hypothetical protein
MRMLSKIDVIAICPRCRRDAAHSFDQPRLRRKVLAETPITLSCVACDIQWIAGQIELDTTRRLLAAS